MDRCDFGYFTRDGNGSGANGRGSNGYGAIGSGANGRGGDAARTVRPADGILSPCQCFILQPLDGDRISVDPAAHECEAACEYAQMRYGSGEIKNMWTKLMRTVTDYSRYLVRLLMFRH